MTKKRGLIIIVTLLMFVMAREFGLFDFFLKYTITRNCNYSFKENSQTVSFDNSNITSDYGNNKLSETKIFIRGLDKNANINEKLGLEIIIKKVTIPFSFLPFYTNIDYEFDAEINDNINAVKTTSKKVVSTQMHIIGNITAKGKFKNIGILSNKKIKEIITNDSEDYMKNAVIEYLRTKE